MARRGSNFVTIRRQPSDFLVQELIDPAVEAAWVPEAPPGVGGDVAAFAVFRLQKRSLTTPEATSRLAGRLGVKAAAVSHAGLKDKHAQTVQFVSVALDPATVKPEALNGEDEAWRYEFVGWSSVPASAAWIAANRFEVVVRDLTRAASDEMEKAARALWIRPGAGVPPVIRESRANRTDRDLGSPEAGDTGGTPVPPGYRLAVVNYFGDQRFGSARHGEGFAARKLVDGDFLGALQLLLASPHRKDTGAWRDFTRLAASKWGKWKLLAKELPKRPERAAIEVLAGNDGGRSPSEAFEALPYFLQEMCVDAYQSHLWNACVRGIVRGKSGAATVIEREDDFGAMIFPASEGARAGLAGVQVPMPGPGTAFEEPWGSSMARVLREEGLTVNRLRIPDLRRPAFTESWRDVLVEARQFDMSTPEADDLCTRAKRRGKRTVRFELPRGAYATVVLRALGQ